MNVVRAGITAVVAALLAVGAPAAQAQPTSSTETFNVCGGSYSGFTGFGLCASVQVSVVQNSNGTATVTMVVNNLSGSHGSYSGTVFTAVGLDNVIPSSINVVNGSLQVLGPCLSGSSSQCDYSSHWRLSDDKAVGGGVKVDLLANGARGINYGIGSTCVVPDPNASGNATILYTSCATGGTTVTLSFTVTSYFDLANSGDLFVKGQNGYQGQSTTCITAEGGNCFPTTVVPEPITIALLGTGLAGIGGAKFFRRRRRSDEENDLA